MGKWIVVFISILLTNALCTQKKVINQDLIWYGVFTTVNINEKWYFQNELQERHYINPTAQHQFLIRSHIHRSLGSTGWETSLGMCLFLQNPNDPKATVKLTVPELRPHVEFGYKQKLKRVSFDHRFRAEARFFHNTNASRSELDDGFAFGNFRFRYKFQATIPLVKIADNRYLKLKLSDELHLNAGRNILMNVFDQNRLYGGIGFDLTRDVFVEAGYLNWFQQRPNSEFFNRDILRFTVFHKVNLKKKSKKHN